MRWSQHCGNCGGDEILDSLNQTLDHKQLGPNAGCGNAKLRMDQNSFQASFKFNRK